MNTVKELTYTQHSVTRISHKWVIDNYSLLREMNEHFDLPSTPFDMKFRLVLHPKEFAASEYLHVRLYAGSLIGFKDTVKWTVSIVDAAAKTHCQQTNFCTLGRQSTVAFVKWDQLLNKTDVLLPNDKLIICCEIILLNQTETKVKRLNMVPVPKCNLAEDFGDLLNQMDFHDLTIETGDGHKIPANRIILSARSKVFAAMFKHPLKESQLSSVTISDFNHEVLSAMLHFIYTGKQPEMEDLDLVGNLMAAADKYELDRLKAICANFLDTKLSIESAATTFKLADLYNVKELKLSAIEFIKMHSDSVVETPNWINLVATDGNLIIESFMGSKILESKLNDDIKIET